MSSKAKKVTRKEAIAQARRDMGEGDELYFVDGMPRILGVAASRAYWKMGQDKNKSNQNHSQIQIHIK
jgi:hypothetical protein